MRAFPTLNQNPKPATAFGPSTPAVPSNMPLLLMRSGLIAFASCDGSIYILKVATGEKVAEFKTNNICYTTPLFARGKLFCGSGDRHLYVIDLDTMSVALKYDAHARVYSSPRLIKDSVIFGSNGGVVRDRSGHTRDSRPIDCAGCCDERGSHSRGRNFRADVCE